MAPLSPLGPALTSLLSASPSPSASAPDVAGLSASQSTPRRRPSSPALASSPSPAAFLVHAEPLLPRPCGKAATKSVRGVGGKKNAKKTGFSRFFRKFGSNWLQITFSPPLTGYTASMLIGSWFCLLFFLPNQSSSWNMDFS